jgi:hypothetical protein
MMTTSIFDNCEPWPDIVSGKTWHFTAELAPCNQPDDFASQEDARIFFQRTYPSARLRELIDVVFTRIAGSGGVSGGVVCLHAPPGGGKTHALRALAFLARGIWLDCFREFITADAMPSQPVRLCVIDGENCDPCRGISRDTDLQVHTPWGELAYQLAGRPGFAAVERWDRERAVPPWGLIRDIVDADPALIILDRLAVMWRRFTESPPDGHREMSSFVSDLRACVASSRRATLVCTLAVRSDPAQDPYHSEHRRIIELLHSAPVYCFSNGVAPEHRTEIADAARRFLFRRALAEPETYPVDGETFDQLLSIIQAVDHTHVFGGTLAVLGRSCHHLWKCPSESLGCIRPDQLDLRPLAERVAYDRWELRGRPQGSAQADIEYAKRFLQDITRLADRIVT